MNQIHISGLPDNFNSYPAGNGKPLATKSSERGFLGEDTVLELQPNKDHLRFKSQITGQFRNDQLVFSRPDELSEEKPDENVENLINQQDELEGPEGVAIPENLTQDECKRYLQTNLDAGVQLLHHEKASEDDQRDFKKTLQSRIEELQLPMHDGHLDSSAAKKVIEKFKKDMKWLAIAALDFKRGEASVTDYEKIISIKLQKKVQDVLSNGSFWKQGYVQQSNGEITNSFKPLFKNTCHHFTSPEPTNAMKTSLDFPDKSRVSFYRHGTFAPQPKKVGEDWSKEKIQQIANKRAQSMAQKMVEDYVADYLEKHKDDGEDPAKVQQNLKDELAKGYTFANLDLMRRSLYDRMGGENDLSEVHGKALESLRETPIAVKIGDDTIKVPIKPRRWMQDIKDAPYFANSKEAQTANDEALKSLDDDIKALENQKIDTGKLADIKSIRDTLKKQLGYQKRPAILRLFRAMGRGFWNITGGKVGTWFSKEWNMKSSIMDPTETSAMIIALEIKIAEHQPGGVSEGCKSGKDRGSLVDAAAKSFLSQLKSHSTGLPLYVLQPGWMLVMASFPDKLNDFKQQLRDFFLANFRVQEANTGMKGYITNDTMQMILKGLTLGKYNYTNYMEDLATFVMDESHSLKAGSKMVKG